MVRLKHVLESNSRIASELPPDLVAVFVGATSGIGRATLLRFASHATQPRVYFVGRSEVKAGQVLAELKQVNPSGTYVFLKADVSLLRNVDKVTEEIKAKESRVNLLFLTNGTLIFGTKTEESLHYAAAVSYYARVRFITNLLPLIKDASGLRRVVSVFVAGKEGAVFPDDLQGNTVPFRQQIAHAATMTTLSLEAAAREAPQVSFLHNFPGRVSTDLIRGEGEAWFLRVMNVLFRIASPLICMSHEECGQRHSFLATSAMYSPAQSGDADGVALRSKQEKARSITGSVGAGVYSILSDGQSVGPEIEHLLAKFRSDGYVEHIWANTKADIKQAIGA